MEGNWNNYKCEDKYAVTARTTAVFDSTANTLTCLNVRLWSVFALILPLGHPFSLLLAVHCSHYDYYS